MGHFHVFHSPRAFCTLPYSTFTKQEQRESTYAPPSVQNSRDEQTESQKSDFFFFFFFFVHRNQKEHAIIMYQAKPESLKCGTSSVLFSVSGERTTKITEFRDKAKIPADSES